jgi:hypothetical protein
VPSGVAIDSSNNVYVVDAGNSTDWLQVFDTNGKWLRQWNGSGGVTGQFGAPQGVAVDSSANIYVADTLNKRIQIFASDGTFESMYGSVAGGQFVRPYGVAVGNNTLFVLDPDAGQFNPQVQVFTISGFTPTPSGTNTPTKTPTLTVTPTPTNTLPPRVYVPVVENKAPAGW